MANQQAFFIPESYLQTEKILKKNKRIVSASEKRRTSLGSEEPRAPYPVFLLLVGLGSPPPKRPLFFPPIGTHDICCLSQSSDTCSQAFETTAVLIFNAI